MKKEKHQVILIVLDGWGYREEKENNAIAEANTPFFDYLWENYPHALLKASGEVVGLPKGQMGNSEIGHITIGIGKKIDNDLVRINKAIENREFENNPTFQKLFDHVKKFDSNLHIIGLLSPGGIHSHQDHLHEFIKIAKNCGVEKIVIHAFTDGRDTDPQFANKCLKNLEEVLEETGVGFIATATGRYFAMDRDKNWDRIKKAEENIFDNTGRRFTAKKPSEIIERLHSEGEKDEFLEPICFLDENGKSYRIEKNDGIFFFNFRADRGRQLSTRIIEKKQNMNLFYATMSEYNPDFDCMIAFPPQTFDITLASEVSKAGLKQSHIAETEKFAHSTFYLNGGRQTANDNEEHVLIETRKDIKTHDQAPEMRAKEIATEIIRQLDKGIDFVFANFANPDVVGHTGDKKAIIHALETIDGQLKRIVHKLQEKNVDMIITADHGNSEFNVDKNGKPHTAHTSNDVPFIIYNKNIQKIRNGALYDIAPTVLELLGIKKPKEMTGRSLIIK